MFSKSLGTTVNEVADAIQNTNASKKTKIRAACQRAYETICMRDWPQFEQSDSIGLRKADDTDVTTLESGEWEVPVPWHASNITSIVVRTPSVSCLTQVTLKEMIEEAGSQIETSGLPTKWAISGQTAQWRALPTDSVLTVKSDDAGNDSTRDVRVVYRANDSHLGSRVLEDVIGGSFSSGINLSRGALAGYPVEAIYTPIGWTGNLTIEDGNGVVIVDLDNRDAGGSEGDRWVHWTRHLVRVWPAPNADMKASITWQAQPPPLVQDSDVPIIPVSTALYHYAVAEMYREDSRPVEAQYHERKADDAVDRAYGSQPVARRPARPARGNILGGTGVTSPMRGYRA